MDVCIPLVSGGHNVFFFFCLSSPLKGGGGVGACGLNITDKGPGTRLHDVR